MIQPDLILIDLALPDIDGHELVSRLKLFMPQTPILVIGDNQSGFDSYPGNVIIFNGFLPKPLQTETLQCSVQALLPSSARPYTWPTSLSDEKALKQFEAQIAALNQANQRLASLNAISALIGSSLDVEHLMDELLLQINKTVDFDSATLLLLKGDILEAAASRGFTEYRRGMNVYPKNKRNSAWHVVNNKLPLIIKDVTRSSYWEARPELSRVRSWLGVPLIYKDRVVGVLTLDKNEPDAFSDTDARYVFTLAYQIAIAVENAQLFEEWEDQTTRLKLINEVAREINTILDMNSLFAALAKAIHERLLYDRVAIWQVNDSRDRLTLQAIYGQSPAALPAGGYQQDIHTGLVGKALRLNQTVLVNDLAQEKEVAQPNDPDIRAEMVVPIFVEYQIEALISVSRKEAHPFDDHDLWTLSSLASQAATALANARLYRDLAQRLRDLAVLNDASQALTSTIALDEMLALITDRVCIALLAENGYVLLVDSHDDRFTFAAASGIETGNLVGAKLDSDDWLIKRVILEDAPLLFKRSPHWPNQFAGLEQVIQRPVETLLLAPLKTRGIIIGLVILINKQNGEFNPNDLNLLSALSQLMAGAVENAQLFKQIRAYSTKLERTVQARTARLQAIKKISQVVSRGLNLDELLAVVGRDISQFFTPEAHHQVSQVVIGLVNGSKLTLRIIYEAVESPANGRSTTAAKNHPLLTLKVSPPHPLGQVISQARPMILNQADTQLINTLNLGHSVPPIKSVMLAPLITGGKTIGLMMIENPLANAFDESDLETLESLAFQVASAVEHARLLQKTREMAIVEERTRLARDMHDGVAQNLAYLLIQVDRCLNMVDEGSKLENQLEQISGLLKQNIDELRRNIFDLRPIEFEGRSLFEVIENFVADFGRRWNLKTTCQLEGEFIEISPEIESSLYRILQEALSNARRHAQCTHLAVKVVVEDNRWLRLEVHDDGQGFDMDQTQRALAGAEPKRPQERHSSGLGLTSMRERANRVGGQLTVESDRQTGTRVLARLPLYLGAP
jgi:GAF domain-containing protein/anti-sigma regulatory factor (Ser/Thr protein kinase)